MKTSFGIKEIGQLIEQLRSENDPSNNELIALYEIKIQEAINKAYSKAFKTVKNGK